LAVVAVHAYGLLIWLLLGALADFWWQALCFVVAHWHMCVYVGLILVSLFRSRDDGLRLWCHRVFTGVIIEEFAFGVLIWLFGTTSLASSRILHTGVNFASQGLASQFLLWSWFVCVMRGAAADG